MGTALAVLGMVAGLAGGAQQAAGQKAAASAASQSYGYQATIADNNARMAKQNADWVGRQGDIEATNEGLKTGAEVSSMKAKEAASGVDVNTGSAVQARDAAARIGAINALTIKSNRAREAWGYQVDSSNEELQAALYRKAGVNAIKSGQISSTGTLLSTAGNFAGQFSNWMTSGNAGSGGGGSSSGSTPINAEVSIGGLY